MKVLQICGIGQNENCDNETIREDRMPRVIKNFRASTMRPRSRNCGDEVKLDNCGDAKFESCGDEQEDCDRKKNVTKLNLGEPNLQRIAIGNTGCTGTSQAAGWWGLYGG